MSSLGECFADRGRDSANNFMVIRLFAASLVVYGHSFALAAPCSDCSDLVTSVLKYRDAGAFALDVFFVISGFLVTASFDRTQSLIPFAKARIFRIFPALIVCSGLLAFVVGPLVTTLPLSAYFTQGAWDFFLSNSSQLSQSFSLPGVFESNRYPKAVDGSLWSLWVEIRLYLIVALAGSLGVIAKRWVANCALAALLGIGLLAPAFTPLIGMSPIHLHVAAFFGLGTFAYINRSDIPLRTDIMLTAALFAYLSNFLPSHDVVFGGALAYGTLYVGFAPKIPVPSWLQDYSYGIYIYAFPIQQIIAALFPEIGPNAMTAMALPLAWMMGIASWFLIEARVNSLKSRGSASSVKPVHKFS